MKTNQLKIGIILLLAASGYEALAQGFNSGSDGSYGPMNITSNTTLTLPPDGIFHCTTINVGASFTLRFNRNALNTPVYLLATGDVTINGTIDVSGQNGTSSPPVGGKGGPGGFDGGAPGFDTLPPGAGQGPGGGKGGAATYAADGAGGGSYATVGTGPSTNKGAMYGSPLLVPLVGGSGSGGGSGSAGAPGPGGGGGGGAILIASSTRITFGGSSGQVKIRADGGSGVSGYANGSGGAVRLVAPSIVGTGQAISAYGGTGGNGRIRTDTIDRSALVLTFTGQASVGAFMVVFPNPVPRLDILNAAGTAIPEGNPEPVLIQLPFGSDTNRTVTVQARDFNASTPIRVVLTPESGDPRVYDTTIDNAAANPSTATVNVTVPVNTKVAVNAWTR